MSDKPFFSKVIKFPTGEPIAPDGCLLVTNIIIGKYGKFKLPIQVCVDENITPENLTMEVFYALAKYYGWEPNLCVNATSENGIAIIVKKITTVAGYNLPVPVEYHVEIHPSTMVDIFIVIATNYKWTYIGECDKKENYIVQYELVKNKT